MYRIEAFDRILYHLEAIDIENEEYLFWDSNAEAVNLVAKKGKIISVLQCQGPLPLAEAFARYLESCKLPQSLLTDSPAETWENIQNALSSRPKKRGFWSRLFSG